MSSKSGCNRINSASAFSRDAVTRISSTALTRSSKAAACSFAFLIAIVSTIAATSGYFDAQASMSSSDLGRLISFLVASLSCACNASIFADNSFSFSCWKVGICPAHPYSLKNLIDRTDHVWTCLSPEIGLWIL